MGLHNSPNMSAFIRFCSLMYLSSLLLIEKPKLCSDAFRQHETVIHENLTITFTEIYDWDKIFNLLIVAVENNVDKSDHEVQIILPGIFVKPIWCPKKLNCQFKIDYNYTNDYEFQPSLLAKHGGVCGLDIKPGPPSRTGETSSIQHD